MKTKESHIYLLCLLLAASSVNGCSFKNSSTDNAPSNIMPEVNTETETEANTEYETEMAYQKEIKDFGGYEFTFLNHADDFWEGTNHIIDYDELTGETVADAVYSRNRKAEEDMNISIKVEKDILANIRGKMNEAVMAGDDIYDIVYLAILWDSVTLTGESTLNIYDVPGLSFESDWWNKSFIESATIGANTLYTIPDYINLMGYAYSNVLYINKTLAGNYNLDMPYESVKNGEWTYDKMFDYYCAPVVNLNGDDNFAPDSNGTAVYGFAIQHAEGTMSLLNGAGEYFVAKDENNIPVFNPNQERLSNVYDKLVGYLSGDGMCVMYNTADLSGMTIFGQERSMFYQGSLGSSTSGRFRDFEFEYGILPLPKYDVSQNKYYTMVSQYTLSMNMPKIAGDPSRTGNIMDYLAFLSYKDVIPEFQVSLCYKGLRDIESIEMFDLILNTQTADIGFLYGWTKTLMNDLCNNMINNNSIFASTVKKQGKVVQKQIDKFIEENQ